ncbi:hypothetical protein diail_1413 [Diaporthe ilicicola]|nr:hypothetical protein diail_1413 [Diaporthe ilicicola]
MGRETKVDIALVSDGDMRACFEPISKAFGHEAPFVDLYFPNHDTPPGATQACKRLEAWRKSAGNSTFLKAFTKADQGGEEHIIGLAIWTLMKEAPPAELSEVEDVEEIWPDKDDREFMARFWRSYVKPRTQTVKDAGGKGCSSYWAFIRTINDWAQAKLSSSGGPEPQMKKDSRPLSKAHQLVDTSMSSVAL